MARQKHRSRHPVTAQAPDRQIAATPAAGRRGALRLPAVNVWILRIGWIGPVLLLLAASAYGVLEVHSSTDTWIGLAAGKQILESDRFPTHDTFSYTFYGRTWYNQNWLTHVIQYWLYSKVAPDAVIYFSWGLGAAIFLFSMLACYFRSGNWLGSVLAASIVALGSRDFLSPRPSTTGFFCISTLWMLICAIEGQGQRRRWWPIAGLAALLLLWGNAHGSFVFAYGMLTLYVAYGLALRLIPPRWQPLILPAPLLLMAALVVVLPGLVRALPESALHLPLLRLLPEVDSILAANLPLRRFLVIAGIAAYPICALGMTFHRPRAAASPAQLAAIAGVIVLTIVLLLILSPFGIGNFVHPGKVAGSELFRTVSEWRPPFERASFPPVWRFWLILAAGLALLPAGWLVCLLLRWLMPAGDAAQPAQRADVHWSLFDVGAILIGLTMTLWARRFAPMFLIFAAPAMLTWVVLIARGVAPPARDWCRLGLMALSALGAAGVALETAAKAHKELVLAFAEMPQATLLERVTRYDATPHDAILFLQRNEIACNLLVEWTQAGPVMFYAPGVKVYVDGRSQQLYTEDHYRKYTTLVHSAGLREEQLRQLFENLADESATDAVLLRRIQGLQPLFQMLERHPDWSAVLYSTRWTLFFRRDGAAYAQLVRRLRAGKLWWPDLPEAAEARGNLLASLTPPDLEAALDAWTEAVRRRPRLGVTCYPRIAHTLKRLGRAEEARRYLHAQSQLIADPQFPLDPDVRKLLGATLTLSLRNLESARQQAEPRPEPQPPEPQEPLPAEPP